MLAFPIVYGGIFSGLTCFIFIHLQTWCFRFFPPRNGFLQTKPKEGGGRQTIVPEFRYFTDPLQFFSCFSGHWAESFIYLHWSESFIFYCISFFILNRLSFLFSIDYHFYFLSPIIFIFYLLEWFTWLIACRSIYLLEIVFLAW